MIDLAATELDEQDIECLKHPLVGGVILFTRNFDNQSQLQQLCKSIRKSAKKPIIIAVDQEGGRVQRFHGEFTRIPAMAKFESLTTRVTEAEIINHLTQTAWLMAAELRATGIDLSFAPVLDLNKGISSVIGDRGFSASPKQIIKYSKAFIKGMSQAGMASTGKHFPGHGSTAADSHKQLPTDDRSWEDIETNDLSVFKALCESGLDAIMPAHVVYSKVDDKPACFSQIWLQSILREKYQFQGTIFSDDLSMEGAKSRGDITIRANQALEAGCDMLLCCNDRDACIELLDNLNVTINTNSTLRIQKMLGKEFGLNFQQLISSKDWQQAHAMLAQLS